MNHIRIRTGVSVINEKNEILLVPHYAEKEILWYLPGGGVEFLEQIENAAIREYKEETGFDIELISSPDFIQYLDNLEPWHSITFIYKGKIIGGELQAEDSVWGSKLPVWYKKQALENIKVVEYQRNYVFKSFQCYS